MKITVSKFGGTSMGDAACMLRSAEISFQKNAFVTAVSATSGTTNQLIELAKTAQMKPWAEAERLHADIVAKHAKIREDLRAEAPPLDALFEEMHSLARGIHLLKDCSPRALDAMVSLGERMSSLLFTTALRTTLAKNGDSRSVRLIDARDVLVTSADFGQAKPRIELIREKAQEHLLAHSPEKTFLVTQGYIGRSEDGQTTTLGRGGSDYSAALFAEAVKADVLEIWTDVAGIATTDPRLCPDATPLPEISFKEASELATFGAKILHPATLAPAMRQNIPVFVGSSFAAGETGTWIRREVASAPLMRAIALRKKQVLVTLSTPDMLHAHGFLAKIFQVFNEHEVSVDAITTSEISVSVTLDDSAVLNKKLIAELSRFAEVSIEENLAIVSLIGNNINHTPGLAHKIFAVIPDINVRMICLGASRHNFCFLVQESLGTEVVGRLHRAFALGTSREGSGH